MRGLIAHRKNRRNRQAAAYAAGLLQTVYIQSVMADVSNGNAVLTLSQPVYALPAWSASMLTFDQSGTNRVDSAWVLTTPTTLTVTIAALATGQITATFGSAASAIKFVGGGSVAGVTGGGGSVA